MIDKDTVAARDFYRSVRQFAQRARDWDAGVLWHEVAPDEAWDLTLVSERVYGRRDEYLAVMAAAGLDSVDMPLTQQRIALPGEAQLFNIKRRTGFESLADRRDDRTVHASIGRGIPMWKP